MNAAARLFNQGLLSRGWVISVILSRSQFSIYILIVSALISALSIIYMTNASRGINAGLQQAFAERHELSVQWGQLLLEKSTWTTQTRIQNIAEEEFEMVLPDSKSVVVINE